MPEKRRAEVTELWTVRLLSGYRLLDTNRISELRVCDGVKKKTSGLSKEVFCSEFYAMKLNVCLQRYEIIALKCGEPFCLLMLGFLSNNCKIREGRNSPNGHLWTAALTHISGRLLFRFSRAERSSCVLGTSSVGFVYISTCFIDFYFVDSSVDHGTFYRPELIKETCKVTVFLNIGSISFR
jgi:hypothetical protein